MDRPGHRGTRVAALVALLLAALPAVEARAGEAQDLFKKGVRALRDGDHAEAARLFYRSYELEPRAAAMCNLALTYDKWPGHQRDALKAYRRCAEDDESGKYRDHALTRSRELREEIRALPPAPAPDEPAGSGEPPESPGPQEAAGPPAGDIAPPSGDGRPDAPPPAARSRTLFYGGLAAGVAAAGTLVTGAVFVSKANAEADDLRATYGTEIPAGSDGEAQLERARSLSSTGVTLYVASGILAAASATLLVLDHMNKPEASAEAAGAGMAIAPLPGGAVLSWTTGF